MIRFLAGAAMLTTVLLSWGCQTTNTAGQANQMSAATSPATYLPPVQTRHPGSLWSSDRQLRLYDDLRARQVGDIVTVSIVENSKGKKSANTQSDRSTTLDGSVDNIFGYAPLPTDRFNPWVKAAISNKFKGTGNTDREDTMSASIACRVIQLLPEGNLYVRGTKEVQLNYETQSITLEGIVRPTDIQPNNVVLSSYLADAKIFMTGSGPVTDKQRPGWLTRVLDVVWPF